MSAQIFLYRNNAGIAAEDLAMLREAGIVPVQVNDFDDVRIVETFGANTGNDVFAAAMQAIAKTTNYTDVKQLFGQILAQRLAATPSTPEGQKP